MEDNDPKGQRDDHNRSGGNFRTPTIVAALAYEFWQARGCPDGTSEEDWFRAEQAIAASQGMVKKEMAQKAAS